MRTLTYLTADVCAAFCSPEQEREGHVVGESGLVRALLHEERKGDSNRTSLQSSSEIGSGVLRAMVLIL